MLIADCYPRFIDRLPLRDRSAEIFGVTERSEQYAVSLVPSSEVVVDALLAEIGRRRVALATDDMVSRLHVDNLVRSLKARGVQLSLAVIPQGEQHKTIETALRLVEWLSESSFARRDVLVAMGGGVVLDTVGWVASIYMRGVPYINVPTTLLAQVDAGLGGKVAVNHRTAKNLIGAFHNPKAVLIDVGLLDTLDSRNFGAGLAEVIKTGIIASPDLFEFIEKNLAPILDRDRSAVVEMVRSTCAIKCTLCRRDPYEINLNRPLNFGHTIGHAVETLAGYGQVLHGEAVSLGMAVACRIARRREWLPRHLCERFVGLLNCAGLPTSVEELPIQINGRGVIGALRQIRKIRDDQIRFVLPVDLGETVIADDVSDEEIVTALASQRSGDGQR